MAYRLHIQVYDTAGKRLSATRLHHDLPGLTGPSGVAAIGSRYGVPGMWIERATKVAIRQVIWTVRRFGENAGYRFRYFATNEPTLAALVDMVRVERG